MTEPDWLTDQFETSRPRLRAVAMRMLGSASEADDAVQETWLRLHQTDTTAIANLGGWLTTVTGRVCLDMLRARTVRREQPTDSDAPEPPARREDGTDPEYEAVMADAVGAALLVVLETLTPSERLAFVLHDLFGVPFEEIAPVIDRTPAAARQLASRARRRVRGSGEALDATVAPTSSRMGGMASRQREIVTAFLRASREGDLAGLIRLLDPDVAFRADAAAVGASRSNPHPGAPRLDPETHGAQTVAEVFSGRARAARPAIIDGVPGFAWAPGGNVRVAFVLSFADDRIASIAVVADPARLREMDVTLIDA